MGMCTGMQVSREARKSHQVVVSVWVLGTGLRSSGRRPRWVASAKRLTKTVSIVKRVGLHREGQLGVEKFRAGGRVCQSYV